MNRPTLAALLAAALALPACGDDGTSTASVADEPDTITLVAYDSFPVEGTPINDALTAFTAETGVEVEILIAGDTGTMLSKATLTAGNPEGDVMWGVDNTFLSRAIDADVFDGYAAAGLDLPVNGLLDGRWRMAYQLL